MQRIKKFNNYFVSSFIIYDYNSFPTFFSYNIVAIVDLSLIYKRSIVHYDLCNRIEFPSKLYFVLPIKATLYDKMQ